MEQELLKRKRGDRGNDKNNRKCKHDLGVRYKDNQNEYFKMYMRMKNEDRVICVCGCDIVKSYLEVHKMSRKHLKRVEFILKE